MKKFILTHIEWVNTAVFAIAKRYLMNSAAPLVIHTVLSLGVMTTIWGA